MNTSPETKRDAVSEHQTHPLKNGATGATHSASAATDEAATNQAGVSKTGNGKSPSSSGGVRRVLWIAAAVLVSLLAIGIVPKLTRHQELIEAAEAVKSGAVRVLVERPHRGAAQAQVSLPATSEPLQQTAIYARTNGYVHRWLADIGASVKRGQTLAILETPELDQELAQVRINLDLARINLDRLKGVSLPGAVSQQERDEKQSVFNATQANVRRLEALASFKRVTAPFSGTITERGVDVGSLVIAGASGSPLFRIAQHDTLRILVGVPQSVAPFIKTGGAAQIAVQEFPSRVFEGRIVRTAGALDEVTRTLLTEIHLPNREHTLMSGIYVQVKLDVSQPTPPLLISSKSLKFGAKGVEVAVVADDNTVHYQTVQLGRDYGNEVEVTSGLVGTERLVLNPTDDVIEGNTVKPMEGAEPPKPALKPEEKPKSEEKK